MLTNNCLLLFMWNVVLQPEFLDDVICLKMHGIASFLPKYGVHLCVCVAFIFISTVGVSYFHIGAYYLTTFRFPHIEKKMFSVKYLIIFFCIYLLDATFVFVLVFSSVSLEAFPSENNVVCYVMSSLFVGGFHLSKPVMICSIVHVTFTAFMSSLLVFLLFSFLRKKATTTNRNKIRVMMRTIFIVLSIPVTLAAIPFAIIFIWSLFVSSSPTLAQFANISSFVAMSQFGLMLLPSLICFERYRRAALQIILRKNVESRVFVLTTNIH
uniref:G_PROTEIN_RECEP_F1_2 domain-containing protein n=1 Tax=Steinernema glaseri TaxID=37863 RepID=A0A1I7Y933_9BILA